MAPNKYMLGAAALAAPPADRDAVGWSDWDWRTIFYDPAGGAYRFMNQDADRYYNYSAAPNSYWKQQRGQQRVSPGATLTAQRQQQAQQMRSALLQQQAANTAALRSQLSQMFPGTGAPVSPGASPAPPSPGGYNQSYAPSPAPQDAAPQPDDSNQEDVVGAQTKPAQSAKFPPGNYVVVRVKNMQDVIRSQSALGKLALMGAPKEIEKLAYGKMAAKMQSGMADEGVDAEVSVTEQPPTRMSGSDLVTGVVAGASGVGLIWLMVKLIGKKR